MTDIDYAGMTGRDVRELCRSGNFDRPTADVARGYAQANLVVLDRDSAIDFALFCQRNPKPCPLITTTQPGQHEPIRVARGADLRTDLPRYRVFARGVCVDRPVSIERYWNADAVAFLIGCSFTFEASLMAAGLPVRHIEQGCNVPMYRTTLECTPAGAFSGPLVVSMRPMTVKQAARAAEITLAVPGAHGAPVHSGDPAKIGIASLDHPDYGDPVTLRADEIPVFWACGVTPIEAIVRAKPELAITHEPGHMFVTDLSDR